MIWTLLRQDPAFRTLLVTLPATVAVALFTRGLLIDVAAQLSEQNPGLRFALLLGWINLWGLLVLVLFKSHFWVRCSRLNLTLPFHPRTLWLTRMSALTIAALIPIAFLTALLAIRLPSDDAGLFFDTYWIGRGVHLGLGAILALVLWQLPSPQLYRAGTGREYFAYASLIAFGVFVVVKVTPVWSVFTLLALVLILAVGTRVYMRLPNSFMLVGREPENEDPAGAPVVEKTVSGAAVDGKQTPAVPVTTLSGASVAAGNTRLLTTLTALRLAHNHVGGWLILGIICLYSFLLIQGYHNGRNLGPYTLFIIIWVWFTINQALAKIKNLDPLPLSRRYLFAIASLPAFAAIMLGAGIKQISTLATPPGDSQIKFKRGDIKVPPEFWEIAREAEVPIIESPSGETHRPRPYHVLRGSDLVVYNPYGSGEDSSPEFVEFQFARAVKAIHGQSITAYELPAAGRRTVTHRGQAEGRGIGTDSTAVIGTGESSLTGPQRAPSPYRSRVVSIGALFAILMSTLILFATMQAYRSPLLKKVYMGIVVGILMLSVASVIGAFFVDIWGIIPPEVLDAFPNVLMRKIADRVPIGTNALWAIAATAFVGCYLLIQNRFDRAELFDARSKKLTEEF